MTKTLTSQHNYHLDLIKVIAIIGVVYLHLSDGYLFRPDFFGHGIIWWLLFVLHIIARTSVPLFMMVSGYLTIGKNYTGTQLTERIVYRLLVPLIFVLFLSLCASLFVPLHLFQTSLTVSLPTLSEIFYSLTTASGGEHFLVALIGLNLLLPVWHLIFTSDKTKKYALAKYLIALSFLSAGTITWQQYFNPHVTKIILNEWRWLLWVGYFLLGFLLRQTPTLFSKKLAGRVFILSLLATVGLAYHTKLQDVWELNQYRYSDLMMNYHTPWLVLLSVSAFVWLVRTDWSFFHWPRWQKMISQLSRLTLGIYVWHGAVFNFLDVFCRLGLDNMHVWQRPSLAVIGVSALTLLISTVLTVICSQVWGARLLVGADTGRCDPLMRQRRRQLPQNTAQQK